MNTYKLTKTSGKTEMVQAKNFQQAEKLAYGKRGRNADPVVGIILQDDDKELARKLAAAAFQK
jgi:hypothetical protein